MRMSYFDQTALLAFAVGLYSLSARRNREQRSTWPTWLLVPIVIVITLPWGVLYRDHVHPYHLLRPYLFLVFALILLRWAFALWRHERNAGWIFYVLLAGGVQALFELLIKAFAPV